MKIQYWGTGAAEGIPAVFCECNTCKEARKRGGKNIRTRSQLLIDDKLMIDFPPDSYVHSLQYDISLSDIEHYLITHTHCDHLYLDDLTMRFPEFSNIDGHKPLNFYGSLGTVLYINGYLHSKRLKLDELIKTTVLSLYKPTKIGDYKVTAIEAIHSGYAVFYLIKNHEGKTLLYANDTNYFSEDAWKYFEKNKMHIDFVSLDCTAGNIDKMGYIGHMNLNDNIKVKDRLTEIGCADKNTIFCCHHFSHNGEDTLYDDFSKIAAKKGFITAYDGMVIDF